MFFRIERLPLLALAGLVALGGPLLSSGAQQPPVPPNAPPPPNSAQFQSVPVFAPAYGPSAYTPYMPPTFGDPYGGYLNGAASVIGSQGQFMINKQQSNMIKQQVQQSKIQTQRMQFDEHLYERAKRPTPEDERERARLEQLRTSRNDPPLTTIWSGQALNELQVGIQRQQAQGLASRDVPLAPDVVSNINVTGGRAGGNLGLLKNGGKLRWPFAFSDALFQADRQTLDKLSLKAYSQAVAGNVDPTLIQSMTNAVNDLQDKMRQNVANMDPSGYTQGLRFLRDLNSTLSALQSPDVANYVNGSWEAKGQTVGQLVQYMTNQGLRFAPASPGEEAAYTALQRAMAVYYAGPDQQRPWDPLAK